LLQPSLPSFLDWWQRNSTIGYSVFRRENLTEAKLSFGLGRPLHVFRPV